ncbi:hypothetical protein ABZ958_19480 [Streptomyces sp. NPDC046237]|uniref:hypothetical protein n=1 Tax=Streptomyces sp. NPDC046237 TaxID=3154914 RepID=UPI0033C5642F
MTGRQSRRPMVTRFRFAFRRTGSARSRTSRGITATNDRALTRDLIGLSHDNATRTLREAEFLARTSRLRRAA